MRSSHYRLERTVVIDHAGSTSDQLYVTTSPARVIAALREALQSGHFVEDNLEFAWSETLTRRRNALAELFLPSLLVIDGDDETRLDLMPDLAIARGERRLRLEVVHPGARAEVTITAEDGATRTLTSLAAAGDAELLERLREAAGEVSVTLHTERLEAAIPRLEHAPLAGPLPFTPWFLNAPFAAFVKSELDADLLACLPSGAAWDGMIPQERWFPAADLLRAFGDAGYDEPGGW